MVTREFFVSLIGVMAGAVCLNAQSLDSLISPGELSSAHAELAGLENCEKCHTPGKGAQDGKCLSCHTEIGARIAKKKGFHRLNQEGCIACHAEHGGKEHSLIPWDKEEFEHDETGYLLTGLHQEVRQCELCHTRENSHPRQRTQSFLILDSRCVACHTDEHRGQLGTDCQRCHDLQRKFKAVAFDHSTAAFQLRGAHATVDCQGCHKNETWKPLEFSRCADCHSNPHRPTLGADCRRCHTISSWQVTAQSGLFHHDRTEFPLEGAHLRVACSGCHVQSRFKGIAFSECRDCHQNDPHRGQFDRDCKSCHTVDDFQISTFQHSDSRYPLSGKHTEVACAKCHQVDQGSDGAEAVGSVRYKPLSTECLGCHLDPHLGQIDKACDSCHTPEGFGLNSDLFVHERDSRYRLVGKHESVTCEKCHRVEEGRFPSATGRAVRYRPISEDCLSCHPDHHAGQFQDGCQGCHSFEGFLPLTGFLHSESRFPLVGRHQLVVCGDCHGPLKIEGDESVHETARYRPLDRSCLACHGNPHRSETPENNCMECHEMEAFSLEGFDHSRTSFALTGKHGGVECLSCHVSSGWKRKEILTFHPIPNDCQGCHWSPHPGRYQSCETCHVTSEWRVTEW